MTVAFGQSFMPSKGVTQNITISSGAAEASGPGKLVLTSETGTTDQLDQITGLTDNDEVTLAAASGHTITIAAGANLKLPANFTLSGNKRLTLECEGSDICYEIARSANQ